MFSFGNENRIYYMANDPKNWGYTAIWYYNKSLNNISKLSGSSIPFTAIKQNPVNISSTHCWIFTQGGLFDFDNGDQIKAITINTSAPINGLNYIVDYSFSQEQNLLLYKTGRNHYLYDLSTTNEVGKLLGDNYSQCHFIEK
jgi:hypothetical protein